MQNLAGLRKFGPPTTRSITIAPYRAAPVARDMLDARKVRAAADILKSLPLAGHTWHVVIPPAKYDFFDLIPALLYLSKSTIRELYLATLGMNLRNAERIAEDIAAGHAE